MWIARGVRKLIAERVRRAVGDWNGNLGRCQQGRRNLMEQRLKDVVATPIDQPHIGATAREDSADDDDSWLVLFREPSGNLL